MVSVLFWLLLSNRAEPTGHVQQPFPVSLPPVQVLHSVPLPTKPSEHRHKLFGAKTVELTRSFERKAFSGSSSIDCIKRIVEFFLASAGKFGYTLGAKTLRASPIRSKLARTYQSPFCVLSHVVRGISDVEDERHREVLAVYVIYWVPAGIQEQPTRLPAERRNGVVR